MMRSKFILFLVIVILLITFGCSNDNKTSNKNGNEEVTSLTFAEAARILSMAPYYVAIEQGFFEDENIDVDISSGGGGAQAAAALMSGDAQFAVAGPRAILASLEEGQDLLAIQALNSSLTLEVTLSNDYMHEKGVSSDSSLEEKLDVLKNATIGSNNVGDSGDVYLRNLMEKHGIDHSNFEVIKLDGNGAKIGGMLENIVDGGVASPPFAQQANQKKAGEKFIQSSEDDDYADLVWEIVYAEREYLEDNPEVAEKVVKAIGKGIEFSRENPEEAAESIQDYFDGVDTEIIEQSLISIQDSFTGHGEMSQEAFDNGQDPLVEFSDMSGVKTKRDTSPGGF